jgi:hypothetical protein
MEEYEGVPEKIEAINTRGTSRLFWIYFNQPSIFKKLKGKQE